MAGVCSKPGCPDFVEQASDRGRCPTHAREREAHQRRTVPTKRTEPADRARRAAAVKAHVKQNGYVCPGDDTHPAHPCRDLTAHHVQAVGRGGDPHGRLAVLCRSRNSAIQDRT